MKKAAFVLNPYTLNATDPRVKARVQKVLDFMRPMLIERRPRPISSAVLTKVFGHQSHALAEYLRANLLQPDGSYVAGKRSIAYTVKKPGFEKLSELMGLTVPDAQALARTMYRHIVDGAVNPEYTEPTPGLRRFHPVQSLSKVLRAELFQGWYDYDIESAAPTLVYQAAIKARVAMDFGDVTEPYPTIKRLVTEKAAVRQQIQTLTGLEPKAVKQILNGLFFSARLQASTQTKIFALVNFDHDLIDVLKNDPFIKKLRREVKSMWSLLLQERKSARGKDYVFKGIEAPNPEKSSERMTVYLELERKVMTVMEDCLTELGVPYVLMHDGFMTKGKVEVSQLTEKVRDETGYEIFLTEKVIGETDDASDDETDLEE